MAEPLRRVLPEVHSITFENQHVIIRSAGLSLHYFGPLQNAPTPVERLRQWRFAFPLQPALATTHTSVRPDVLGVFINGLPIYNQREAASYNDQNLWHFDPLANPNAHGNAPGLLETLLAQPEKHSPLIGYALDGFPIYGPWGYAQDGSLCPLRSSYRLRAIQQRTQLADGTRLAAEQAGPEVSAKFPLGTFAEDYAYVAGAGELDEFNGRFAVTPEYPQGTYAYFLSLNDAGRFGFPYLLAHAYAGRVSADELQAAARDEALPCVAALQLIREFKAAPLSLRTSALQAGLPTRLSFQLQTTAGQPVRHLAYAHERPLHLLVVSEDLSEFAHIHPELVAGDCYEVQHTFAHGGKYRLYADFTAPGATQRVVSYTLNLTGKPRATVPLTIERVWEKTANATRVQLASAQPLRAGEDLELAFMVRDAATNTTPADLEPYLGAWAHCVVIDQTHESFVHAHPLEATTAGGLEATTAGGLEATTAGGLEATTAGGLEATTAGGLEATTAGGLEATTAGGLEATTAGGLEAATAGGAHTHATPGPPPETIRVVANFPRAGRYKLWLQVQRAGQVITVPFVIEIAAAAPRVRTAIPAEAIAISVGADGFAPAQLNVKAGQSVKLAFTRKDATNCGGTVVFPALNLRRTLPVGETVLVEFTPDKAGTLSFTCGMGMLKGALIVQ